MLRLLVLCTVVVYCHSCSLYGWETEENLSNPEDCSDQDGNIHTFNTEWEDDTQNCVCSTYGTICCPRFGFGVTEFFADDFVTFSANDEEYGSGPGLIPEERLALKWAF
nr:beta-microseminoprotein-like isoform X2 [Misgurnus anguillicaudatus]